MYYRDGIPIIQLSSADRVARGAPGMSPEPIFGPKFCFFLRYTHITTFIWAQEVRLNRNISPTYPEVTLDTFGFPVGGRLAAQRPVFFFCLK